MAQPRLPGTSPAPAEATRNLLAAIEAERQCEDTIEALSSNMRTAKEALKLAKAERKRCEDDIRAVEAGRRPG